MTDTDQEISSQDSEKSGSQIKFEETFKDIKGWALKCSTQFSGPETRQAAETIRRVNVYSKLAGLEQPDVNQALGSAISRLAIEQTLGEDRSAYNREAAGPKKVWGR